PFGANTGSNFFFLETSSGATGAIAELISPEIDLSALTEPTLSFFYHMFGPTMGALRVDVRNVTAGTPYDNDVWVLVGEQQTAEADPYRQAFINLMPYAGNVVELRFRGERGTSFTGDLAIDDVSVDEAPPCFPVANVQVTNIGFNTADVSWTEIGTATLWDIEVVLAGTPPTGTPTSAGVSNPHTLTGLSSNTAYEVYVRADCAVDGTSTWSSAIFFQTECAPFATPYVEDFGAFTVSTSTNIDRENCWEQPSPGLTTFGWRVSGTTTPTGGTGPSGPADGTPYAYFEAGTVANGSEASFLSPLVDLSNLTNPALKFDYHMYGSNMGDLNIDVRNVSAGTSFDMGVAIISGQQQTANADPWANLEVDLSAYTGNTIQVRFRAVKGSGANSDVAIDQVTFEEASACPAPINLANANVQADNVDLSWNASPSAVNGYIYSVFLAGADPLVDTPVVTNTVPAGTTSVNVTGLSPVTQYEAYVQADCGAGGLSLLSTLTAFETPCAVFVPDYLEDFITFVPPCWEEATDGDPITGPTGFGSGDWVADGFLNNGTTGSARIELWNLGTNDWLLSPEFDLSAGGFELRFDIGITFWSSTAPCSMGSDDELQLLYTDDNGVTWNNLQTWAAGSEPSNAGELININLSAITGTNVRFAFWGTEGVLDDPEDCNLYIDNFEIRTIPACSEPTQLGVNNITATTAELFWTDNAGASLWDVEIGLAGFTPTGTPTTAGVTNPYTAGGLTADTDHDFYVRADCGAGAISVWAGPFSFKTECATFTTPHVEDFTTFSVAATTNFIEENCWEQPNTGTTGFGWRVTNTNTPSTGTGPSGPFVGPNYFFLETSSGTTGQIAELIAPIFDLSPLASPALKFHFHMFGVDMGSLRVDVRNVTAGTPFDNDVFVLTGQQQTSDVAPWSEAEVDLSAYVGAEVQVRFRGERGVGFASDMAIDNFRLEEASSCPAPINLANANVQADSVDLSWDASPTAVNGYIYSVFLAGADPLVDTPAVTNTVPAGTTSVNVTGLSPITQYEAYVQADCGAGGLSSLSAATSFETPCAIFVPDYLEDFTTFVPSCWEEATDGDPITGPTGFGSGDWLADGFLNNGTTGSARIELWNLGTSDWLLSPEFNLSAGGFELRFDIGITVWNSTAPCSMGSDDELQLLYTADNGVTWNNLQTWAAGSEPSNAGELININLSAITGTNVRFAFWGTEGVLDDPEDCNLYIDNFEIRTIPACSEPTQLGANNITATAADLFWTDNAGASLWDVEWGLAGFVPTGSPTDAGLTAPTLALSGLTASTSYDFYVRADCGANGTSIWIGPFNFSTEACDPSEQCDYTFRLIDDFGDGWNGNSMDVRQNGITIATIGLGFTSGPGPIDEIVSICDGATIELFWNFGGDFAGEVGVEILDASGTSIFNRPPDLTIGAQGTSLFTGVASCPSCAMPTALSLGNVSDTTADVSWTASPDETSGYSWVVVAVGDDPLVDPIVASGTTASGITTANITGLSSVTDYDFYVETDCGSGFTSGFMGPLNFTTTAPCAMPTALSLVGVTDTTADVSWTASPDETNGYSWVVVAAGDDPLVDPIVASGTTATGVTAANVTGLAVGTDYDFYVETDCGNTNFSGLAGPLNFMTEDPFNLTCGDSFFDTGGPTGNYGPNEDLVWTICPDVPGEQVTVTFTAFDVESNWDGLYVFDGPDINAPQISSGNPAGNVPGGVPGAFWGTAIIGPFTSSDASGCLTFRFRSDPSFQQTGWEANVTCNPPPSCNAPTALTQDAISFDGGDFSWTASPDETDGYIWLIMNDGDDPLVDTPAESGTTATGVTNISVNTLNSSTTYQLYVQTDCGAANGVSLFALPALSFTTTPVNDDACNDIALTVGATSGGTDFTNVGATAQNNEPVAACFNAGINGSVWFTFVAPASGDVTITTDIAGATLDDTEIALYDAPSDCNDLSTFATELACDQDGGGVVNFNSIITINTLTPGNTYYVQVDRWGTASDGEFGIEVIDNNPINPPANDDCANAINLLVDGVTTTQTTQDATDSGQATACGTVDSDVWFSFTAPATGNVDIETLNATGFDVYSGTCGALVSLGQCGDSTAPLSLTGLTPGDILIIQVFTEPGDTQGDFDITLTEPTLSIDESPFSNFKLYPNPTSSILNLDATEGIERVELINMLGQVVIAQSMDAVNNAQVNMSDLADGTYIMRVSINGTVNNFRVIKK
ncbi:MAG: fibronectin type III domain-containing protein, partial [Flavobacteriaceae bacterium]|nr:fibronectin type III domain-containing protein [Flavobacteriaceae bacterium]